MEEPLHPAGPSLEDIERELRELYTALLCAELGMAPASAESAVEEMLDEAKREGAASGTLQLPLGFGDVLLKRESADEDIRNMLEVKRKEGVTDDDIRWWWNMHDLERRMILKMDEIHKLALFVKLVDVDGLPEEEAAGRVYKRHPLFGDPRDETYAAGGDRPLPYELKERINEYVARAVEEDPEAFDREMEESSSFNALVRRKIEEGEL